MLSVQDVIFIHSNKKRMYASYNMLQKHLKYSLDNVMSLVGHFTNQVDGCKEYFYTKGTSPLYIL